MSYCSKSGRLPSIFWRESEALMSPWKNPDGKIRDEDANVYITCLEPFSQGGKSNTIQIWHKTTKKRRVPGQVNVIVRIFVIFRG